MANTIRASKNNFSGGLVMDLSPDNTPNQVLTSALNATLVTFNGNDALLQNDMGNGRVETARLPEGYIPVGTCEFGDIIYIVSYNPLTNKSLIGCFPSPERNITTEEIGGAQQFLSASDFQDGLGGLKTNSVKKILYNNKLNPGDKFIIYNGNGELANSARYITDFNNISLDYGTWPKFLRIHVIAIEDSGKITYLDSTLHWYNDIAYFIRANNIMGENNTPDLDAYRTTLSSGFSVFQSKVSGKLALLIELEKITGFSCAYNIYSSDIYKLENNGYNFNCKRNKIYWTLNWDTDNNDVNPRYIVLTKSEWVGKDESKAGKWYYKEYDLGNNQYVFSGSIIKGLPAVKYPDSGYYYATIDATELSENRSSYNTYVHTNGYKAKLDNFLNSTYNIKTWYNGAALTKLNIRRSNEGSDPGLTYKSLPQPGHYYINAVKSEIVNNQIKYYTLKSNNGQYLEINSILIPDYIVNNYFHSSVYKYFAQVSTPVSLIINDVETSVDASNLIYKYEITPAMEYGLLSEYAIEGYIDFSKIGSGIIDITGWRYFIGENIATLTLGLDAYTEENKGIAEVVLEFYDNQGIAASYHIANKESYSGTFSEMIPLNGSTNSYKLRADNYKGELQYHCGLIAEEGAENTCYMGGTHSDTPTPVTDDTSSSVTKYVNDAGTLYSNMLYLVKIVVKYCPKDSIENLDTTDESDYRYFYRWFWTNAMFNEHYYTVTDYDVILAGLILDIVANYQITDKYYYNAVNYKSPTIDAITDGADAYKYLSAKVLIVTNVSNVVPDDGSGSGSGEGDDPGSGGGGGDSNIPLLMIDTSHNPASGVFRYDFNMAIDNNFANNPPIRIIYSDDSIHENADNYSIYVLGPRLVISLLSVQDDFYISIYIPDYLLTAKEGTKQCNTSINEFFHVKNGVIQ